MFILNLAGADLVVCIFSLPITPITTVFKTWYFGATMCHGLPWMQGIAIFIGTFSLCAISADRYILVVMPTRKLITKTVIHCLSNIQLSRGKIMLTIIDNNLKISDHVNINIFN